ncbi:ribosomal protein L28e [Melanomma pulvis-pyrius CBS 109.77]|uniref:Ribosomal protein L28e n=1 Tax=Melanomma pulvis-pyrius CBS 109.77 TaxID=1314802 RepID=A0A6A6XGQ6_9PLEO|nr:ribosomal protein L28e [Melanomma pulvis-pyrius CBS 109.77]
MASNISADLIWEVTRKFNSSLVKRKQPGGVQFSRNPLNLRNQYTRKYEGSIADKAIGVQAADNGGVTLLTKKSDKAHAPSSHIQSSTFGSSRSTRKTYSGIVNSTTKRGYRPDLRKDAVARASAIRKSQQPVKEDKPAKLRGAKARAAEKA